MALCRDLQSHNNNQVAHHPVGFARAGVAVDYDHRASKDQISYPAAVSRFINNVDVSTSRLGGTTYLCVHTW